MISLTKLEFFGRNKSNDFFGCERFEEFVSEYLNASMRKSSSSSLSNHPGSSRQRFAPERIQHCRDLGISWKLHPGQISKLFVTSTSSLAHISRASITKESNMFLPSFELVSMNIALWGKSVDKQTCKTDRNLGSFLLLEWSFISETFQQILPGAKNWIMYLEPFWKISGQICKTQSKGQGQRVMMSHLYSRAIFSPSSAPTHLVWSF